MSYETALSRVAELTQLSSLTLPPAQAPAPTRRSFSAQLAAGLGIVVQVNPDGSYETVEGNYGDAVSRAHRDAGAESSFVRLG